MNVTQRNSDNLTIYFKTQIREIKWAK